MADYDGSTAIAAAAAAANISRYMHSYTNRFIDGDGILFSFIYNDDTHNFNRYFMGDFGSLSIFFVSCGSVSIFGKEKQKQRGNDNEKKRRKFTVVPICHTCHLVYLCNIG